MATHHQQQQEIASAPPPKDKKNKKRQKAAAAEAANNGSSSTQSAASTSNPVLQSTSKPAASPRKQRFRSPAKRSSQPREAHEMYGVELPVPPSPRFPRASTRGKEKEVEQPSNSGTEEGEVESLEGLFFVDTKPRKLPKDLQTIEKPVISPKKDLSPLPALERSPSLPPQSLLEDKVVPDYVGTSSEIKELDVVKDEGADPVEGSSKDLLDAIIKYSSFKAPKAQQTEPQVSSTASQSALKEVTDSADQVAQSSPEASKTEILTTQPSEATSPGGTKRKREDEAITDAETKKRHTTTLLGDLLSDDDSTSSEEEKLTIGKVDAAASESDGDSSAQEDPTHDDIALNMAIDTVGKVVEPPLAMEVDLTGSAVREEDSTHQSPHQEQIEAPKDLFVTDLSVGQEGAAPNEMDDDDIVPPEGVENDEYTADRSRYFKEDDPLKLCARCGETGHTVRDCAHVQCLTCGKLDDHGTRSCPLTMTCFRCNSRGHHIKDCPLSPEEARNGVNQFCERCSSHTHKSSTCPYIWRVYIRAADAPSKPPKIHFACYNCASAEHFGDDCKFPRGHPIPNSERTAFTIDPDNNRKSHIRFDNGQTNNSSMPRPNIDNGRIASQREVSPPPSHAPRGPRSRAEPRPNRKERRRQEMARPSLDEELRSLEEDRRRHGDFGNLGDLEAGEIDEDEDAFERRLDKNKNEQQQPNLPKGPRPGARDRRRAREGGSKSNTAESSVNGDAEPKRSFQPFKHFTEPPGVNGHSLNRPRSLSRSPPPARRREGRQPSPVAMDSPAQARSAEQWKRDRGLKDRVQGGRPPARSGGGGGGFASGSLLDRIDRGSSNSTSNNNSRAPASRDPRSYDSPVQRETRPWSVRAPAPPARRANGYTPHAEPSTGSSSTASSNRRGGNPHYKGGYF